MRGDGLSRHGLLCVERVDVDVLAFHKLTQCEVWLKTNARLFQPQP